MANETTRQELLARLRQHEEEADAIREARISLLQRLQVTTVEIQRLHRHLSSLDRKEENA